jgi:hypothetical protein
MGRATFKRALGELNARGLDRRYALALSEQLGGVFDSDELRYLAEAMERLGRRFGGVRHMGPFVGLPQDSGPMLTARTVALAAAALEERLLALLEPRPLLPLPLTVAEATNYSTVNIRQAVKRTLTAMGLPPLRTISPRRSAPAGTTIREIETQTTRDRERARKRAYRHRVARESPEDIFAAEVSAHRMLVAALGGCPSGHTDTCPWCAAGKDPET